MEEKIIASESFHWYKRTGEPCYEVENKSKPGEMRPVTLKDAKKLDLVPSVTSVLQLISKPGLNVWKMKNVLMSALTLARSEKELDEAFVNRILVDADEQAVKARQKGTDIHGAIEKYLSGQTIDNQFVPFVIPVIQEMEKRGMLENRKIEHSFCHPIGYGGKIDYHNDTVIIDYKSKEFTSNTVQKLAWPEHAYQLGGYRFGILMPYLKCFNVFISTTEPGLYHFYEWEEKEIIHGTSVFLATLELWKKIKKL